MAKISNKVYFPSKYIELKEGNSYLLINFDNSKSRKFSRTEYDMFCKVKKLEDEKKYDDIAALVDNDPEINKFILQLIMSGMLAMKPFEKANPNVIESRPLSVYWGVSSDCNFRCKYCYADCGSITNSRAKSYLSKHEYQAIIDKIKDFGFVEIVFTGGEPLLNSDVFDMASYAKEKELSCGLLTNGSLISKYDVEKFKIFNYVKISFDSAEREINDQLRGKGSYDKIINAIKILKSNDINVDIGTVITKYNKDSLEDLITYLHTEFDVKVHTIANHIPLGRGSNSNLNCSFEELQKCDEIILKTKCKLAQNGLYSIIQDFFFPNGRKVSCGMGMSEIYINEKGDVYPCRMTYEDQYYLGNLLQEELNTILGRVNKITEELHVDRLEGCCECDFRYLCGGGCRIYHKSYSGSIYKNHLPICEAYKRQLISLLYVKNNLITIE
jgi:radical SAM protein with 4Fe4S-binding SPASM domain